MMVVHDFFQPRDALMAPTNAIATQLPSVAWIRTAPRTAMGILIVGAASMKPIVDVRIKVAFRYISKLHIASARCQCLMGFTCSAVHILWEQATR